MKIICLHDKFFCLFIQLAKVKYMKNNITLGIPNNIGQLNEHLLSLKQEKRIKKKAKKKKKIPTYSLPTVS